MISERLKILRKELRLTQEQMCTSIGIESKSTYTSYEQGRSKPKDEVYNSLCDNLAVSLTWLISGKGEMFLPNEEEKKTVTKPSLDSLLVTKEELEETKEVLASKEELKETKEDLEKVKRENQTLQERLAKLESLEQTKLVRENCVLQGKVSDLEKRLEALENLAASYLQKDKMA